ncbi:MAG: hypothetical protein IJB47_07905, partial [Oscillospiraceae bacterium]|nr:hypothetical protein [Oscillospiraceae bacterium]
YEQADASEPVIPEEPAEPTEPGVGGGVGETTGGGTDVVEKVCTCEATDEEKAAEGFAHAEGCDFYVAPVVETPEPEVCATCGNATCTCTPVVEKPTEIPAVPMLGAEQLTVNSNSDNADIVIASGEIQKLECEPGETVTLAFIDEIPDFVLWKLGTDDWADFDSDSDDWGVVADTLGEENTCEYIVPEDAEAGTAYMIGVLWPDESITLETLDPSMVESVAVITIPEQEIPNTSQSVTIGDEEYTINADLPEGVTLTAGEGKAAPESLTESALMTTVKTMAFDISPTDAEGKKWQPADGNKVTVTIDNIYDPEFYGDDAVVYVYHILDYAGAIVDSDGNIKDGVLLSYDEEMIETYNDEAALAKTALGLDEPVVAYEVFSTHSGTVELYGDGSISFEMDSFSEVILITDADNEITEYTLYIAPGRSDTLKHEKNYELFIPDNSGSDDVSVTGDNSSELTFEVDENATLGTTVGYTVSWNEGNETKSVTVNIVVVADFNLYMTAADEEKIGLESPTNVTVNDVNVSGSYNGSLYSQDGLTVSYSHYGDDGVYRYAVTTNDSFNADHKLVIKWQSAYTSYQATVNVIYVESDSVNNVLVSVLRPGVVYTGENKTGDWHNFGLVPTSLSVNNASTYKGDSEISPLIDQNSINMRDMHYPNIEFNGKVYRYAKDGSDESKREGYYTIKWLKMFVAGGGTFNYPEDTLTPTGISIPSDHQMWHLDGQIFLNTTDLHNVAFMIQMPESTTWDVYEGETFSVLVGEDTLENTIKYPGKSYTDNETTATYPSPDETLKVNGMTYTFDGWYRGSYGSGNKIDFANSEYKINQTTYYYGKYVRNTIDLTITKQAANGTTIDPTEAFIFTVKDSSDNVVTQVVIYGTGSTTIKNLPADQTHTVTENTDWSWRYTSTDDATKTAKDSDNDGDLEVTFTNRRNNDKWLDSSWWVQNIFGSGKTEPDSTTTTVVQSAAVLNDNKLQIVDGPAVA